MNPFETIQSRLLWLIEREESAMKKASKHGDQVACYYHRGEIAGLKAAMTIVRKAFEAEAA